MHTTRITIVTVSVSILENLFPTGQPLVDIVFSLVATCARMACSVAAWPVMTVQIVKGSLSNRMFIHPL